MAGRRPKPTHIKLVTGNPGHRPLNPNEPKARRRRPDPPAHLSEQARVAWDSFAKRLDAAGVLTEFDGIALEGLCEAYADLLAARETLRVFGAEYYQTVSRDGSVMWRAHPALAAARDADRRVRAWLSEFGMTPSARSKVDASPDADSDDPADQYFS